MAAASFPSTFVYSCAAPTVYAGKVTYYDNTSLGMLNCSYSKPTIPTDTQNGYTGTYYSAVATHLYNTNMCGACAEVTSVGGVAPGTMITVPISDQCPQASNPPCFAGSNHLDLSIAAFKALNAGNLATGIFSVNWKVVPCPNKFMNTKGQNGTTMTYTFKDSATQFYAPIQIRDYPLPIHQVDYGTSAGGPWTTTTWQDYNFWLPTAGTWPTVYLRIQDAAGNTTIHGPISCCGSQLPAAQDTATSAVYAAVPGVQQPGCGAAATATRTQTVCVCSPTFTATPTVTPADCPVMLNSAESLTINGTWSGANSTRTLQVGGVSVTEGSNSMKIAITTTNAFNSAMANLSGFSPAPWPGVARLTMDVYVDPANLPWTGAATYHDLVLQGAASSVGKFQQGIASVNFPLVAGMNNVSFTLNYPGTIVAGDPMSDLFFCLSQNGLKTGNLYFDNIQLHTDAICPPASPTSTSTRTGTETPTRTVTATATSTRTITGTSTQSPTASSSFTRTSTSSSTSTRTMTPTQTVTMTPPAPTFTSTSTASATSTSTRTSTATPTSSASATPSRTMTGTPTQSLVVPSNTSTNTPLPGSTFTDTSTMTPTATRTSTATPTATRSATPSMTATASATVVLPSITSSNTPLPGSTFTDTSTVTPTRTRTSTITLTVTPTGTSTPTATASVTVVLPSFTSSNTPLPGSTFTDTATMTPTSSRTVVLPSSTSTNTPLPGATFTDTLTITPLPTQSSTPTPTFSSTQTLVVPSATPSITVTFTSTVTNIPPGAPGEGSATVSPSMVTIGDSGVSFVFTYTAVTAWTNGTLRISLPAGWPAPSSTGSNSAFTTVATSGSGAVLTLGASVITVNVASLPAGGSITLTYGSMSSGGAGLTVPSVGGFNTFTTQSDPNGAAVADIASHPVVNVKVPTATSTDTPSSTPVPVATNTFTLTLTQTPASTSVDSGVNEIEKHAAYPSPWDGTGQAWVSAKLEGHVDRLVLKVYTKSLVCVGTQELGAQNAGWTKIPMPTELLGSVSNGTYFYVISSERAGTKNLTKAVGKFLVLR